jgi:hypothetical protein
MPVVSQAQRGYLARGVLTVIQQRQTSADFRVSVMHMIAVGVLLAFGLTLAVIVAVFNANAH